MKDIIYRKDAIDALKALSIPLNLDVECEDIWERDRTIDNAIGAMRGLPSAEPKKILTFSERLEIAKEYKEWCYLNNAAYCPESFLAYLCIKRYI